MKKTQAKHVKNPQFYKFTSVSTLYAILQYNGFRFNSLKDLNDVYESIDIDENGLLNFKTLSFTRCHSSILMWAHYAEKYKGCVVQIRKEKYQNIKFQQVDYMSRDARRKQVPDYNKLLVKGYAWHYEKEHRVIIDASSIETSDIFSKNDYFYLTPYIKHVYFGPSVEDTDDYFNILTYIKNHNKLAIKERRKCKDEIRVSKYKISNSNYELKIDENFDIERELARLNPIIRKKKNKKSDG